MKLILSDQVDKLFKKSWHFRIRYNSTYLYPFQVLCGISGLTKTSEISKEIYYKGFIPGMTYTQWDEFVSFIELDIIKGVVERQIFNQFSDEFKKFRSFIYDQKINFINGDCIVYKNRAILESIGVL